MTVALRIRPAAKVNLWLRVLGRRADGFHELDTVFHAIDLRDDLVAIADARPNVVELTIDDRTGGGLPVVAGDDNLVVRAARAVLDRARRPIGLRFHLVKRIPAGGGLGGGSADAAAALRLAARFAGVGQTPREFRELALGLGADVPFFLVGGTCRGGGVGERLVPLPSPERFEFLLLLPPFGTATGRVFSEWRASCLDGAADSMLGRTKVAESISQLDRPGPNDLLAPALRGHPELARLIDRLRAVDVGPPHLSGSGSTLFLAAPATDRAAVVALDVAAERVRAITAETGLRALRVASAPRTIRIEEATWPSGPRSEAGESL